MKDIKFENGNEYIRLESLVRTIDAQLQRLEHPKSFYVIKRLFEEYNGREKSCYRKRWGEKQ